jgi:hypothetical protein
MARLDGRPLLTREIVPRTRFDLLRGVGLPGSPRQATRTDRCVRGYGRRKQGQGPTREKLAPRRTSCRRAAAGLGPRIGPARRLGIRPHRSSAEVKPSLRLRAGGDRPAAKVKLSGVSKRKCQNPLDGSPEGPKPATPPVFVRVPRENSVARNGPIGEEMIFNLNLRRASVVCNSNPFREQLCALLSSRTTTQDRVVLHQTHSTLTSADPTRSYTQIRRHETRG